MEDRIVEKSESIQNFLESTAYRSTGLGLTRDTRATIDQVLDPKTVEVLQKMIKQGCFDQLAGCISTGKEANVYFGVKEEGETVAVKVYKTSILGFRDRDEYVDGEYRFRHGYCKSNPRKMVSLWAEKEQRNLNRISLAGLHCPRVIRCKRNVLVMSLIGEPGRAAPRLKDAAEPTIGWTGVYEDVVVGMRTMFQSCRLVHGDLSEYNMLMDGERVAIIDVSQSVGVDHPRSLEFLKRDCLNVNLFFSKKLDSVIPLQDLFRFVIEKDVADSAERLEDLMSRRCETSSEIDVDDSVFLQTWVPASLGEVGDICQVERLIDDKNLGLASVFDTLLSTEPEEESQEYSQSEDESDGSDEETGSVADSDSEEETSGKADGHKPDNMTKQEWKKKVKEEQREKRQNKVPKHLKNKRNFKKYGKK